MAALYSGVVSHGRMIPAIHTFSYGVSMFMIDVNVSEPRSGEGQKARP